MKKIIVIVGPTGVGKTKLSIELAEKLDGEIINADSTQVYKEINIGTAKITNDEMNGIIHHIIDIKTLSEEYTVYDYQLDARNVLDNILSKGKTAIIVGGSGLYLSALLYDYKFNKEDNVYDFDSLSDDEMYNTLKKLDSTIEIDKRNRQRLIRAYAKYVNGSEPINSDKGGSNLLYDVSVIGLTTDRDILYKKINNRADQMIENGLIKEVRELFKKYPNAKQLTTTIGYKEFMEYIKGNDELDNVISNVKQNSRNYAKRQYTWFNHKMDIKWFETNFVNFNITINKVIEFLEGDK